MAGNATERHFRSFPPPAWLATDSPSVDVTLSSRCRVLRNLVGHRFPHRADPSELKLIAHKVMSAAAASGLDLQPMKGMTPVEREHFVSCRLASHSFDFAAPGRVLLIDEARSISIMVNEEDHLRIQALTSGWSIKGAEKHVEAILQRLSGHLDFAWSPQFGFLAASPFNVGQGRRLSAMFHLIGLADSKRLPVVLRALAHRGLTSRGLFGESSRAIGAFVQVSSTKDSFDAFSGACDYLIEQERAARRAVPRDQLIEKADQARGFARSSPALSLADAYRVLGWARWAASESLEGWRIDRREVDSLLSILELRTTSKSDKSDQRRAETIRAALDG